MSLDQLKRLEFLTVAEIAEYLKVSKMTVYRLVEARHLRAVRVGRSYRIPAQALMAYLERNPSA
jgi:excisionase family DNA binding protein